MSTVRYGMMAMLASIVCIGASRECSADQVINLSELNQKVGEDFWQGRMRGSILECSEGMRLPVKIAVKGEFLALESFTAPTLRVLKTCYIRCIEQEHFLFSEDLQNWKEFSEFFTGRLSVSLGAEDGQPIAELQLELDQR